MVNYMYCETPPYGDLGNLVNLWSLFSGPAEWSYIILQKNPVNAVMQQLTL